MPITIECYHFQSGCDPHDLNHLCILKKRVVLKQTLDVRHLVLVTMKMSNHSKEPVDICQLKKLSISFKSVSEIPID